MSTSGSMTQPQTLRGQRPHLPSKGPTVILGGVNKCSCDFGRRVKYIHPFKEKKKHVSFNAS